MKKLVVLSVLCTLLSCHSKKSTEVVVDEDSILTTYSIDTVKVDSLKADTVVVKDSMK